MKASLAAILAALLFLSACGGGSSGDVAEDDLAEDKVQLGVYRADQDTIGVLELYSATPDGAVNDKLNGALVADGDVANFAWPPMRL